MAGRKAFHEDFVLTLSDGDDEDLDVEEIETATATTKKRKRESDKSSGKRQKLKLDDGPDAEADMASDFEFQIDGELQGLQNFDAWESDMTQFKNSSKKGIELDEIISKRRIVVVPSEEDTNQWDGIKDDADDGDDDEALAEDSEDELLAEDGFGMGALLEDEDRQTDHPGGDHFNDGDVSGLEIQDNSDSESVSSSQSQSVDPDAAENLTSGESEEEEDEEKAKAASFFAPEDKQSNHVTGSFQSMHLSRPILRGLAAMQFSEPTPIQAKAIPVALLGKDIVGSAVTGSGKTAAFMIPILERLLYRSKKVPTSRVAILMPTRELAVQCFTVGKKLASFTDVTFCQLVGGFSLREQEQVLKQRPDIIIATPGRFIDHMRNSASFTIDTLEILVLDEADRMLEDGFADELNEILTTIPKSRQTMLFSATMTSSVDRLIGVGLNRPVRLMVDAKKQTVTTLTQEFLRLRPGREEKRLAYLLHLCQEVFTDRCIIFFRQKKEAHRVRIIFALFGFKASELHGNMTQEQRISSVEKFRAGTVSHLLATDVAARGLDIKGVKSVINYEGPQSHEIYLHRVGRTARAGRSGKACTLASEADRKVVKAAVKTGKAQGAKIVSRTVEPHFIDEWVKKLDGIDEKVDEILHEEKDLKELANAEMQIKKGENMLEHRNEIQSRPKRTWFEGEKEKKAAKQKDLEQLNGTTGNGKKFKRKLSGKEKKKMVAEKERALGLGGKKKTKTEHGSSHVKTGSKGKAKRARK